MLNKTKSIFDPKYREFIASIIRRRKSVNMTQREIATKLGVSHCYIARIETHERRLDMLEAIDMMKVLGMSDKEIIDEIKKLI